MQRNLRRALIGMGALIAVVIIAAIAVPAVVNFTGCACSESKYYAESDSIILAMSMMMADMNLTQGDPRTSGPAVNDWTGFPTGPGTASLIDYLKGDTSTYYYCWTAEGEVFPLGDDPDTASKPGECYPPP